MDTLISLIYPLVYDYTKRSCCMPRVHSIIYQLKVNIKLKMGKELCQERET